MNSLTLTCPDAADLHEQEMSMRQRASSADISAEIACGVAFAAVELLKARHRHTRHCALCLAAELAVLPPSQHMTGIANVVAEVRL